MSILQIPNMDMPECCDDCSFLDDNGDYPMCRISQETRGYDFKAKERRMDRCPLQEISYNLEKETNQKEEFPTAAQVRANKPTPKNRPEQWEALLNRVKNEIWAACDQGATECLVDDIPIFLFEPIRIFLKERGYVTSDFSIPMAGRVVSRVRIEWTK